MVGTLEHLVPCALLLWNRRIKDGWSDTQAIDIGELEAHLHSEVRRNGLDIPSADLRAALEAFVARNPRLIDWYTAAIASSGLGVQWQDAQPRIPAGQVALWTLLSDNFDQDSLLTLDLVLKGQCGVPDRAKIMALSNWRTIPRAYDFELNVLWSRGLSDMHVHASGVRIPQACWLEIMASERATSAYAELQSVFSRAGSSLSDDMAVARASREMLYTELLSDSAETEPYPQPLPDRWWSWSSTNLVVERTLLASAWHRIHSSGPRAKDVQASLNAYLDRKHLFVRLVRQPAFGSIAGLRHFDRNHFGALKNKRTKRRADALYGASPRLTMATYGNAVSYLLETRDLRRAELRISPFRRPAQYWRFFSLWDRLKRQIDDQLRPRPLPEIDIRFAVHFQRSRSKRARRDRSHIGSKMIELDSQTAALRTALADASRGHYLAPLARLDVAGQERDTPCAAYGFHIRLLRGDPDALKYLEAEPDRDARVRPSTWTAAWQRLLERDAHRQGLGERRLGLTVHAGEDYADVLDGLYQVASAVECCGLDAGDGIGHGLALVAEMGQEGSYKQPWLPLGVALDELCWLYNLIEREDVAGELRWARLLLREKITAAAERLYGPIDPTLVVEANPDDHVWLWRMRESSLNVSRQAMSRRRMHMLVLQGREDVLVAREQVVCMPDRQELDLAVKWAQPRVFQQVRKSRIVVEANPSSNMRISGARAADENPAVRLMQAVANGLLVCINTDNPGVFATCIENEYSLLLQGLSAKVEVGDFRALLERVRQIGMELLA